MKVLCLSPHTDDAEVGCGATIAKHVLAGDEVYVISFSACEASLPEKWKNPNRLSLEHAESMEELGVDNWVILNFDVRMFEVNIAKIRDIIYQVVRKCYKPDIIYTPWSGSLHQDHEVISRCTEQVCRHENFTVLGYYVCDDGIGFAPRYYEKFDDGKPQGMPEPVKRKLAALDCYKTQQERRPWWSDEIWIATMRYWSPCTEAIWTEAFEVIRSVSK